MTVAKEFSSSLGVTTLPDTGTLTYNGITFSALYKSEINGVVVQDEANRTTKYMEWTLVVDGIVTLSDLSGAPKAGLTTDAEWNAIRQQLSVHGQYLVYTGQGFGGLVVNGPGTIQDVAWGPVPAVIDFKPLGQGRAAMIRWQVVTRIPELAQQQTVLKAGPLARTSGLPSVLQYNYESEVTYEEDCYATISIHGIVEIPLTRNPASSRKVATTVDQVRKQWMDIQFDLTQFKVVDRKFHTSRDKRTCEWSYTAKQLKPMGLPLGVVKAEGTMDVTSMKMNIGGGPGGPSSVATLMTWQASLKATYTLPPGAPQRAAAWAWYSLLTYRVRQSALAKIPDMSDVSNAPQQEEPGFFGRLATGAAAGFIIGTAIPLPGTGPSGAFIGGLYNGIFGGGGGGGGGSGIFNLIAKAGQSFAPATPIFLDFAFHEGLYEKSNEMSFEASWFLPCTLETIFAATGVWKTQPGSTGGAAWAATVKDIMGYRSFADVKIDPNADVIVDIGGGTPLGAG